MLVSDGEFLRLRETREIEIDPFNMDQLQPASYDMTLGADLLLDGAFPHTIDGEYVMAPNEFLLATTIEEVRLNHRFAGRVEGKSSLGRKGLLVHVTAGFVDPGFRGRITLELKNLSGSPIVLKTGQKIAQMTWIYMDRIVQRPYGHADLNSKYQDQSTVTESRV